MAETPFDKMIRLDAEYLQWYKTLPPSVLRANDRLRRLLFKTAKGKGMSDKGARAWASLKLEELRRLESSDNSENQS
jgi:hypothetical protein